MNGIAQFMEPISLDYLDAPAVVLLLETIHIGRAGKHEATDAAVVSMASRGPGPNIRMSSTRPTRPTATAPTRMPTPWADQRGKKVDAPRAVRRMATPPR